MEYIKNSDEILSHGNVELRKKAIDILNSGLNEADPYVQVKKIVSLEEGILKVGELKFSLEKFENVYVLGAGKATFPIAKALDDILGDKITDGAVICKYGQEGELRHSRLYFANHPTPDEAGLEASREIMKIALNTKPNDIIFSCITGGSTSLMPMPPDGITVEDLKETYSTLLKSGANIIEMNAVRKHICKIKGGRLAQAINKDAIIINLTVSDVVGDMLDYITCPTVPDTSDFKDAQNTLNKYNLWNKVPISVNNYLKNPPAKDETPKELSDHTIHNFIIVPGDAACVGAEKKAKELGFNTMILSSMIEGESREVGTFFAAIGKEVLLNDRPIPKPCAIIGGGETTVKITGESGVGGSNQQFAVSAATWIDGLDRILVAGLDTDGTDGGSDLAGAIVDGTTMQNAIELGIDLFESLDRFDDSPTLRKLKDHVYTGATGTNVNDLKLLLVE